VPNSERVNLLVAVHQSLMEFYSKRRVEIREASVEKRNKDKICKEIQTSVISFRSSNVIVRKFKVSENSFCFRYLNALS